MLFCVSVLFCVLFLLLYIAVTYFLYKSTDHCHRMEIRFSKYISYHSNSNLLPADTEPWHEQSALISVTNRNSILFFAPTSPTTYTRTISPVKRKSRPDVKFCPQTGHFRGGQLPNRFARAHTKAQTPSTRDDVCQFLRY